MKNQTVGRKGRGVGGGRFCLQTTSVHSAQQWKRSCATSTYVSFSIRRYYNMKYTGGHDLTRWDRLPAVTPCVFPMLWQPLADAEELFHL